MIDSVTWRRMQNVDVSSKLKSLEARLESKLAMFSGLASKMSGDIEGGASIGGYGGHEERSLSRDIDRDLSDMNHNISLLRNDGDSTSKKDFLLRRYENIYSEYMSEYAKLSGRLQRAKETSELFQYKDSQGRTASAVGKVGDGSRGENSATEKLLRERGGIASSLKGVTDVIAQAYEVKESLLSQRGSLGGAQGGLTGIIRAVPSFNKLIERVSRKKDRETMILASLIGVLTIFTIWWLFMR